MKFFIEDFNNDYRNHMESSNFGSESLLPERILLINIIID